MRVHLTFGGVLAAAFLALAGYMAADASARSEETKTAAEAGCGSAGKRTCFVLIY